MANIFEQYGIKEVADVTIYAIELDKYDNEIYIPVMYLDTLKVSTLEQTAEQTSARGGQGNPELITWDYGKEISLSLEDALYTPASQSLMWGGKFGIKKPKVQGLWNPIVYPKDEYGRTIYLKKEAYTIVVTQGTSLPYHGEVKINDVTYTLIKSSASGKWECTGTPTQQAFINSFIQMTCPCDSSDKLVRFVPAEGTYKYHDISDLAVGYKCPKGYDTGERIDTEASTASLVKSYYWNFGSDTIYNYFQNHPTEVRPERAEMAIDNYGNFDFTTYDMTVLHGTENDGTITIDSTAADQFCIYTPIKKCDEVLGDGSTVCGTGKVAAYGYEWKKSDMKMTSLEGNQDIYYLENASLRYRIPRASTQKEIMIAREGFYNTEYNAASDPQWEIVGEEIINMIELTRQNDETQEISYGYEVNPYDSAVDFYMNISINLPGGTEATKRYIRVPLGRFYIVADWNFGGSTAQDLMNPINSGIENVHVLDRMEKCKATQTFAIDTNKNLAMANYRYMQEYSETPLTVFIDPKTMKPYEANTGSFTRQNGDVVVGNLRVIKQHEIYYKWTRSIAPEYTTLGHRIIVDAKHFPGVYRIVGETYARSREDGKDQRYQFEIPLAKLSAETNLTLQADGDPTTFNMNFKVLRRDDGVMMKLTQYNVDCDTYDGYSSGSTKVVPMDTIEDNIRDIIYEDIQTANLTINSPKSLNIPITGNEAGGTSSFNVDAGLNINTRSGKTTYSTNTLNVIDEEVVETSTLEPLNNEDLEISVQNTDEEVGE